MAVTFPNNTKEIAPNSQTKNIFRIAAATVAILLLPLLAMQFTDQVVWTSADFIIAGGMLFITGLMCLFILSKLRNSRYRFVFVAVVVLALILLWLELAVGIFGTPIAGS